VSVLNQTILLLVMMGTCVAGANEAKPRVIVLTDIANEPDDEESMVRFLVYANEYEVEGLISTTSVWLRDKTRPDLIHAAVDAYGQVRANLALHAPGFPEAAALKAVVHDGQHGFGMAAVGAGKSTAGSRHIIEVVDRPDERPIWISVWGGANTLAQALWDVKYTRTPAELARFVAKLRVYTISDQDDAGRWLRITFPDLFYIVSPGSVDNKDYHSSTWSGISGDRFYRNGPMEDFELVQNPWLEANIIVGHGPLGARYPKLAYIMEGDTPSFLGLIDNGLGWRVSPAYGGWGGRYELRQSYGETRPIWTNSRDLVKTADGREHMSSQATVWRWRRAFQHDFAARMDWCVKPVGEANHPPLAVLNGDRTKAPLELAAPSGGVVTLDAGGTKDPDGQTTEVRWFAYPEAGTCRGAAVVENAGGMSVQVQAPVTREPCTAHVILEVRDAGQPQLTAYRRAILMVKP
jgi:hypothetical protein